MRFVRRFLHDETGAAMVEFAVIAVAIFLPLTFGVIELGRAMFAKTTVTAAAREGVRFAIVRGGNSASVADSAAVANYVKGRTRLSPIIVKPTWPGGDNNFGTPVTVQVTYTFVPLIKIFPNKTITSTSRQVIAY